MTTLSKICPINTEFPNAEQRLDNSDCVIPQIIMITGQDPLTGFLTRVQLREQLKIVLAEAEISKQSFGYLAVGIDNLDIINEAYGYDVQDDIIIGVGKLLYENLRDTDIIGRLSGSKFGLLMPNCDDNQLLQISQRLGRIIRNTLIKTYSGSVVISVSFGTLLAPRDANLVKDIMLGVEESLKIAQNQGPDNIVNYQPDTGHSANRLQSISLIEEVTCALAEDRLLLAYQPVVRANAPDEVAFYECLIRMRDRNGDLIQAKDFIPVTEKMGMVRLFDRRVLALAFETLHKHPTIRLSINLSPQSVQDSIWLQQFMDLARGNPNVSERLTIEITESSAIYDINKMAMFVDQVREFGCSFALDDFGAGYTSFRHFKQLKLDMVKIDGLFVRGLCDDPDNQLFVQTLVKIAENFGMVTVAEMVDDAQSAELLREYGVDYFQSYYFGKPEINPNWLGQSEKSNLVLVG